MNNLYKANLYNSKRGDHAPQNNKVNFKKAKDNTIKSLSEVGCFLNNFNDFWKYVKLYKLLR